VAEIEMAINSVRHGLQRDEWAIILKEKAVLNKAGIAVGA